MSKIPTTCGSVGGATRNQLNLFIGYAERYEKALIKLTEILFDESWHGIAYPDEIIKEVRRLKRLEEKSKK